MKFGLPFVRMITAHAGCEGTSANTPENIRRAIEIGCDALELDLRFSGGVVYLAHDAIPDTENFYSLDETLEELTGSKIKVNCDIKEDAAFVPAIRKFMERGMADRMIMTGNFPRGFPDEAAALVSPDSEVEFYINLNHLIDEDYMKLNHAAAAKRALEFADTYGNIVNFKGYNMPYQCASRALTDALHESGLQVSVWTPSDFESIAAMVRLGADNITTRTPTAAMEFLSEYLISENSFADEMFLRFEDELMRLDIANEAPEYRQKLLRQYQTSRVTGRQYTSHGFYTHFEITDKSHSLGDGVCLFLGSVAADVNDLVHGTGCALIIRDGLIACIEGYAYDETFPEKILGYKLKPVT